MIFFILLAPFLSSCSPPSNGNEKFLLDFGNTNFSKTTQLFLLRPSSFTYFLSTSFLTTISEKSKQNNWKVNTFFFVDEDVWDYQTKSPASSSFAYHFENLFRDDGDMFSDFWVNSPKKNTQKLGIISNLKQLLLPESPVDVEKLSPDVMEQLNNLVETATGQAPKYTVYIDDLLFLKLYENYEVFFYALLCWTEKIYILPEGLSQSQAFPSKSTSSSITQRYYFYFSDPNNKQLPPREKKKRWNAIFEKTKIGSDRFFSNYSTKFANSEEARKNSNINNFLNWEDKINIFFFDPDYMESYASANRKNNLSLGNIFLNILDYPEAFGLNKDVFINIFNKIFFSEQTPIRIKDTFLDDKSRDNFDEKKKNVIILLSKEWSLEYIKNNVNPTDNEEQETITIFQNTMKKYADLYPPEKYNYIFKGHPRFNPAGLNETTKKFCETTTIKPIQFEPKIPFELLVNLDNLLHAVDGQYELINFDDYLNNKESSDCKAIFLTYNLATTALNTTVSFIHQKYLSIPWKNIFDALIPKNICYIQDEIRINGLTKKTSRKSMYLPDLAFEINYRYYDSVVTNFIKIGHYPDISEFIKYSLWLNS